MIEVAGTVIHRVAGGELTEGWWNWDTPGLPQPLGAILTEQPGDRSCSPT